MDTRNLYEIKDLFARLAMEDEGAFKILFELYKKKVFAVALKMIKNQADAEEIVQDVFLSIWVSKTRLGEINDPEAYLFTITYNTIYSHLKKASRNRQLLNAILHKLTEVQHTTEETIAANESERLIGQAIQQLSPQQKIVYGLSRQEGLSYEQIAERMQLSRNTVRNHQAEALKSIRLFLKKAATLFFSLL